MNICFYQYNKFLLERRKECSESTQQDKPTHASTSFLFLTKFKEKKPEAVNILGF